METNQISVDFQTESDVVRLHITLFDPESEEDDRNGNDSEEDVKPEVGTSSDVWDDDDQCESDDDFIPEKKRRKSSKKKSVGNKKPCIRIRGGQGPAAEATTPIDTWSNLISPSILDKIVISTNYHIDKVRPNFGRERDAAPTDRSEMRAFIGLLYMLGLHRGARLSLRDFWDTTGIGIELFRLAMTHRRFRILMRCLGFDESCTNDDDDIENSLESVNGILNEFAENCLACYSLGTDVSIDVLQDGRHMHKSFFKPPDSMEKPPAILALTDSQMLYTHSLKIFVDQEENKVFPCTEENVKIIEELCEPLVKPVQRINADKRLIKFTSILHELSGGGNNPQITYYDRDTKNATPITTLSNTYDVHVPTKQWALTAFFQMLNVAGINSQIIYTGNGFSVRNRRTFLRQLAIELTKEHMARRGSPMARNSLPCSLQTRLLEVTNQPIPPPPTDNKRRLCHTCLKQDRSRKSTKYKCANCGMYLCLGHVIPMCRGCHLVANHAMEQLPSDE